MQADALLGYARELAREGQAPPPTYIALGMLVERLREEQSRARVEFAGRFGGVLPRSRPQELEAAARRRREAPARAGAPTPRRRSGRWLGRSSASSSSTGDGWRAGARRACRTARAISAPARDAGCTVRVRVAGERAFLTIKGPAAAGARDEYEYPIPVADAEEMLERLCAGGRVEKLRHRVPHAGRVWEVDEFAGENAPLVVAEVELDRIDAAVALPPWVGPEVTDDPRYTNAALARRPYSRWGRP